MNDVSKINVRQQSVFGVLYSILIKALLCDGDGNADVDSDITQMVLVDKINIILHKY